MTASDDDKKKPSEAMMQLLAPDGYYKFLGIEKTGSEDIDADLIKKNYRKLSLRHHPGTWILTLTLRMICRLTTLI